MVLVAASRALDGKNTTYYYCICYLLTKSVTKEYYYYNIIQGFVPNLGTLFFPSTFVIYIRVMT